MIFDPRYTTVITGITGQLGVRLLPQLHEFSTYGVGLGSPQTACRIRFESMDVGRETCCQEVVNLLRECQASSVVHLAFMKNPPGNDANHLQRMWQVNVAGTARIMEAITEVNRTGGAVRKFIFPSSALVYGPDVPFPVKEDAPLAAYSLPWALHKQEADDVVRLRAGTLGDCTTYLLRPHAYAATPVDSFVASAARGVPARHGRLAERWRGRGKRLPIIIPRGEHHGHNRFQFVHVDDVARLIAWILRKPERTSGLHVLNVAGRGPALTLHRCADIARNSILQGPSRALCGWAVRLARSFGLSSFPPEALPYLWGSCTTDTTRLYAFLGSDYEHVMRYTNEEAFAASFRTSADDRVQEVQNSLTAD